MSEFHSEAQHSNGRYDPRTTVRDFILERTEVFRDLQTLREKGWKNPNGDAYFKSQRKNADEADEEQQRRFFEMMQKIGFTMEKATGALSLSGRQSEQLKVLDICIAPGGFTSSILRLNPTAAVFGITLPIADDGHKLRLSPKDNNRVTVEFIDVTMLSSGVGVTQIPTDHSDFERFIKIRPFSSITFDLVICDGQVLRTHKRAEYREKVEAKRLILSQLVVALQRVETGGTIIILLHKLETWENLKLLYHFRKFSQIQLFKHYTYHAKRSSFYMIAQKVNPHNAHAVEAVATWKRSWESATFGSFEDGLATEEDVKKVLVHFGKEFIQLGIPVWETQKNALEKTDFCKDVEK